MQVETILHDDRLICVLTGSFGFSAYESFGEILAQFSSAQVGTIEIDLSGLTSIDSVASTMLRVARDVAMRMGRKFELTGAAGDVARVLKPGEIDERRSATLPIMLQTDDAPSTKLLADCQTLGITAAMLGTDGSAYRVVRFGVATVETVQAALTVPGSGFFELADDGINGIGPRCLEAVRLGGIALSVLTSTACALELPQLFEAAVRQRFPLGKRSSDGLITLCLAEAVSNAVIHGNLGIASGMRGTREGFALFRATMSERLADPARSGRRVEISLQPMGSGSFRVAVTDRGDGFDWGQQLDKSGNTGDKQGRGLSLIRKSARIVSAEDGGRTITMSF